MVPWRPLTLSPMEIPLASQTFLARVSPLVQNLEKGLSPATSKNSATECATAEPSKRAGAPDGLSSTFWARPSMVRSTPAATKRSTVSRSRSSGMETSRTTVSPTITWAPAAATKPSGLSS